MEEMNTGFAQGEDDELKGRSLLFHIGDTLYGITLRMVIEIIKVQSITRLPGVPAYMKGIINLRGKVVPVIDVRLKFGMEERPYDDKTCIVVADLHGMQVGIIVDSVSEVVRMDPSQVADPPCLGAGTTSFLAAVCELEGRVALEIDCERFFESELSGLVSV